jgi:long-chain acyl-CoA synthetase
VFFAVPRVWEKIYSQVMISLSEAGKLQQAAYAWAIGVGGAIARCRAEGREPGLGLALRGAIARWRWS